MKAYIITIIGAALLSAMAGIIAPDKWRGYVRIITGLVVISCIAAPVMSVSRSNIFAGFDESMTEVSETEDLQARLVFSELRERIDADIEKRLRDEYGLSVTAECSLKVNDSGEFEGVGEIRIYGARLTDGAKNRLCEVYGLDIGRIRDE